MNRIHLIGNLCHSPELRATQSGKEVCSFSIAVNRRFRDANGERKADFFNVQVWGQMAPVCAQYLAKGRKVGVAGSMQSRQYDGKDGTRKTAWEVVADEVEFLSPMEENREADAESAKPTPKAKAASPSPKAAYTVVEDEELPF